MKMNYETPEKFRILFYNSKMPVRRVKENLHRYGFNEISFADKQDEVINTANGADTQVIVLNHHAWNDPHTPAFLFELRKSSDVPVVVWSDDLNELISRKLLSFKNTYTLRLSDGFISLTEILQRIQMKTQNPALWV
jgi:hypothetical protein